MLTSYLYFGKEESIPEHLVKPVNWLTSQLADFRGEVFQKVGIALAKDILTGNSYRIAVDDVGYDKSTHPVFASDSICLEQYSTIGDLVENEFTGNTVATYCSGSGLAAETIADKYNCDYFLYNFLVQHFPEEMELSVELDDYIDIFSTLEIDESAFLAKLYNLSVDDFFSLFRSRAEIEIAKENSIREAKEKALQEKIDAAESLITDDLRKEFNLYSGFRFEKKDLDYLTTTLNLISAKFGRPAVSAFLWRERVFSMSNAVENIIASRYPFIFKDKIVIID